VGYERRKTLVDGGQLVVDLLPCADFPILVEVGEGAIDFKNGIRGTDNLVRVFQRIEQGAGLR